MCFKPKITVPEVATPAQAPPALDDLPTPKGMDIGGSDQKAEELGGTGSKAGKSGLKIKLDKKPAAPTTGANIG